MGGCCSTSGLILSSTIQSINSSPEHHHWYNRKSSRAKSIVTFVNTCAAFYQLRLYYLKPT